MLDELDEMSPDEQSRRMRTVVKKLKANDTRPEKKLATADIVTAKCTALVRKEAKRFVGLTLPLSQADQKTVASFMRCMSVLDGIYIELFDAFTDKSRSREPGLRDLVARSLLGQFECLLEAILLCSASYMTLPKGIWTNLHTSWRKARKLKLSDWSRDEASGSATIEDTYELCILLGLCDPYQMPFRGIFTASDLLASQRHGITIGSVSKSTIDRVLFRIDPRLDKPAVRLPEVEVPQLAEGVDVIDATQLVKVLSSEYKLPNISISEDILDSMGDSHFLLNSIRRHLQTTLGVKASRAVERSADNNTYEVVAGFEDLSSVTGGVVMNDAGAGQTGVIVTECSGVDISPNGIRLKVSGTNHRNLRTGDVIGVRRVRQDAWTCGIIRWNQVQNGSDIHIGVEFLQGLMMPAQVNTRLVDGAPAQFAEASCIAIVRQPGSPDSAVLVTELEWDVIRRYQHIVINGVQYVLTDHSRSIAHRDLTFMHVRLRDGADSPTANQTMR